MEEIEQVSILLVDDREANLLALEAILADPHSNLVKARSGNDALRALLQDEYAVILLDVNMPGLDGFETATLIRQRGSCEYTPIIFITAHSQTEADLSRGYALGAVDYIHTPVVAEVLRAKVAVFVELFRNKQQVKRQAEALRQRAAQLHKLTAASLVINSALSMDKMLKVVTDTARDIIAAHQSFATMSADATLPQMQRMVSVSSKYAGLRPSDIKSDWAGLGALVCRTNKPMRLTRQAMLAAQRASNPRDDVLGVAHGWLAAPLTGRDGRNIGLIELSDKQEGEFTANDETVLVQLAQIASIAIENTLYTDAREANRIKDEFLATLSHELRTPLTAMLGWTRILRNEKPDAAELAHGLEVIERNVTAQAKLIEDLLDVSRIITGKLRLTFTSVNLAATICAAADALRPIAAGKQIEIQTDFDPETGGISGDPDRLEQIVWNLLSNAVKFTPKGGRVTLRLERAGDNARISVTDTGKGISPGFLPYVFDRFRQGDSTSSRSFGGLGIGLAIVRHLVELHGGSVQAQSAGEGKGATFTVTLPMEASHEGIVAPLPQAHLPPVRRALDQAVDLRGAHVLIVDDEPDARELLCSVLSRCGAKVTPACSAREAVAALDGGKPDLLLSDIGMPDGDGYALIRMLRARTPEQGGMIPAIALTAYAREDDQARALATGFQVHLAKPVEPIRLIEAVAGLLGKKGEIETRGTN